MKIVDRKTFLNMPVGTVYSKYRPIIFGDLMIKGESIPYNDFLCQQISDAVGCEGSSDFCEKLTAAEKNGVSVDMDFDCQGRDGMFDDNQLFAVWSIEDVEKLVMRLQTAIEGIE